MYFCAGNYSLMAGLFLYTYVGNSFMAYAIWGLGGVAAILLFALIFIQRRTGKRLKGELAELAKIRQGNVEYEFILKAMKLSTWQMDPRRRMITFSNDFRGGQDHERRACAGEGEGTYRAGECDPAVRYVHGWPRDPEDRQPARRGDHR